MRNLRATALLAAWAAVPLLHCSEEPPVLTAAEMDPVVATVNGIELRRGPVVHYLRASGLYDACRKNRSALDTTLAALAQEVVFAESLDKAGLFLTEDELTARAELEGLKLDRQATLAGGILDPVYRRWLVEKHTADLQLAVEITPEEIKAACEKDLAAAKPTNGFLLRQIVTENPEEAESAVRLLTDEKATFEEVARLYSDSPDQGSVRFFASDNLAPEFAEALLPLKNGERSEILNIPGGMSYIFLVERSVENRTLTCEEITPQIETRIRQMKAHAIAIAELKDAGRRARIQVHEKNLHALFEGGET